MQLSSTSSLFPYTTLFRSDVIDARFRYSAYVSQAHISRGLEPGAAAVQPHHFPHFVRFHVVEHDPLHARVQRFGQDRKSTRLNSSHLGISYAVFFLKKKKH